MRVTAAHIRQTAMIVGLGLIAFATMFAVDHVVGRASPFTPGLVSLVFMVLWICLLRRYGPHPRLDPRQRRRWFFFGSAAAAALAMLGVIAAAWMTTIYPLPSLDCRAPSSAHRATLASDASGHGDRCER